MNVQLTRTTTILALATSVFATGAWAQTTNLATKARKGATVPILSRAITLTGTVGAAPVNREFFMRANGETYRVKPLAKVGMEGIRGGDRVRVFGRPDGLIISFANVRVLDSRASDSPSDYLPTAGTTIQSLPDPRTGGPRTGGNGRGVTPAPNPGMMQNNRPNTPRGQGFITPGTVGAGVGTTGILGTGAVGTGVVNPGIIVPGTVSSGVAVPGGVVTAGGIIPNQTTLNGVKNNTVKAAQPK